MVTGAVAGPSAGSLAAMLTATRSGSSRTCTPAFSRSSRT